MSPVEQKDARQVLRERFGGVSEAAFESVIRGAALTNRLAENVPNERRMLTVSYSSYTVSRGLVEEAKMETVREADYNNSESALARSSSHPKRENCRPTYRYRKRGGYQRSPQDGPV